MRDGYELVLISGDFVLSFIFLVNVYQMSTNVRLRLVRMVEIAATE